MEDEPVLEWFYDPVSWPSHDLGCPKNNPGSFRGFGGPKRSGRIFFPNFLMLNFIVFLEGNSAVVPLFRCMLLEISHVLFRSPGPVVLRFIVMYYVNQKNWNRA